jgi:hypothetical protein
VPETPFVDIINQQLQNPQGSPDEHNLHRVDKGLTVWEVQTVFDNKSG